METMIFLIVVNVVVLLAFGRGAVRSAAGFFRLVLAVAAAIGGAAAISAVTGETRMTESIASQAAAGLALAALASVLTVAIATVRFVVVVVAALVTVINDRHAAAFRAEADKAWATENWSDYPAWCRAEAAKHEEAAEAASRWLYHS